MADGRNNNQIMGLSMTTTYTRSWGQAMAATGLALVLAGCGWWSGESREQVVKRGCPGAGILADARMKVDYRGSGGRDITDVAYRWELLDVATICDYDETVVSVDYALSMSVNLGPAARESAVSTPVFVALTKDGESVMDKTYFDAEVEFAPGQRSVVYTRTFENMEIEVGEENGAAYEIIIGFQLTPQEVEENRRRARY